MRAGRRSLTLHKDVDAGVGQVRADERKIRQVVLNLPSNAIKFMPEGGRIEVAAVPRDGSVEVTVSDTGVGIAPEDQEAVFEEFREPGVPEAGVGVVHFPFGPRGSTVSGRQRIVTEWPFPTTYNDPLPLRVSRPMFKSGIRV